MSYDATPRERILKNIRRGLINQTPEPFPALDKSADVFARKSNESLEILFAEEFGKINGKFVYCLSSLDFVRNLSSIAEEKKWQHVFCWDFPLQDIFQKHNFTRCKVGQNLDKADAGVTLCECLIARTGSVIYTSKMASGRSLPIFPPAHIIVGYVNQLVYDISDGLQMVKDKYGDNLPSMVTLNSGPSRTADIEKTLVLGAHGPKEVYVFLIDDSAQ